MSICPSLSLFTIQVMMQTTDESDFLLPLIVILVEQTFSFQKSLL